MALKFGQVEYVLFDLDGRLSNMTDCFAIGMLIKISETGLMVDTETVYTNVTSAFDEFVVPFVVMRT
jgi:hypothetical protein